MNSRRLVVRLAWLAGLTLILAGCAGGGSSRAKDSGSKYQGEFKEFDLFLYGIQVTSAGAGWELYPGTKVDAWAFAPEPDRAKATVPGPEIRVRERDTVRVNFYIMDPATMAHTIHWHGVHVPWDQDGVPYVSQLPIGATQFGGNGSKLVSYEFTVQQSGTYWYHCHVDTAHHLDMGMYGPLVVEPADPKQDPSFDHEVTLMIDEWDRSHSHQNTAAINSAISRSGDPRVTANDFYSYVRDYLLLNQFYNDTVNKLPGGTPGVRETRDWYPVTYAPFFAEYDTFLINGKAFPSTEPIFVKTGETLRIRLVNAGEQVHVMHLHGHHFLVTHTDGYLLTAPYYKDTLLIGPGERYDVYLKADNPGPWMFHDHIAFNEANDYINPGGMATMLCYTDGWEGSGACKTGHTYHQRGQAFTAGDLLELQYNFLRTEEAIQRASSGTGSSPSPSGGIVDGVRLPEIQSHGR